MTGSGPIRVAFVLHSAKCDGAGKAAVELLASLREPGVDPYVLLPSAGPLEPALRTHVAAVKIIPYRWWLDRDTPGWKKILRRGWNLAMVSPVSRAIRRWDCEIVYTNTLTVSVGALAARRLRLPHVWHAHELWGGLTGFEFDLGQERSLALVDRLSTSCIANSQTVADRLASAIGREKLHVVYQSVTLKETGAHREAPVAKLDPDAIALLVVASVLPLKRQEDAIRAVAALKREGVKTELWLVGDDAGPYVHNLHHLAALENLETEVRFFGFRENPLPFQQAADVVLSCSPVEAFGRATVEGMLAGKPMVAARGGGNSELVEDGIDGLLYEAGNVSELAHCIASLARNAEERARLGDNARNRAHARFSDTGYGPAILEILRSAALKRNAAHVRN